MKSNLISLPRGINEAVTSANNGAPKSAEMQEIIGRVSLITEKAQKHANNAQRCLYRFEVWTVLSGHEAAG